MPRRERAWYRYGFAVAVVLGAVLLRLALRGQLAYEFPFITFIPAVAIIARYAGLGPTLLAVCLSALAVDACVLPPDVSIAPRSAEQSISLILFVGLSLVIAWLGQSQRQAIQAVAAEKDRLHVVVEGIGDAVVATDEQGLVTFLNPTAAILTGWNVREAVGRPLIEVVDLVCPETSVPLSDRLLDEVQSHRSQPPATAFLRSRTGVPRDIEYAAAPTHDAVGHCAGLVLVFRDIRERQRTERALLESEARFRQLADAMPQMVWVTRPDGYHEYYNRRWYEYTGQAVEDSTGHGWRVPLHPDDRDRAIALWHEAVASGEPYEVQYRIRGTDGRYRWFLGRALPVHDATGRIAQWYGTCTDIDIQKRTEEALIENRQRLRAALVASNTGTFRWNLHTDEVEFDESLDHLFGLGPSQPVSRIDHFTRSLHPDDLPAVLAELDRCRRESCDFDMEFRILLPDDQVRWLLDRGKLLYDASGYPTMMIGACVDISQRKEVEAELIAAKEQAEAASRAKDQFLAMLSHELRTPLTPVLMTATAMLDDPHTPADFRPFLDLVRQNIDLEARLIDDLLDVMRIIRNKLPFRFEVVDLHELIQRTVDICCVEVEEKGVTLVTDLSAIATHVRGDLARLQQVLWNLVKNAAKFTPTGGTITVRTYHQDGDTSRVIVEIIDTGIGMDPDALPRIFNAFEQAEDAITRQYGGLGLGLAISRSIAEAHGGSLTAWSAGRDEGATFTLVLDTVPAPTTAPPVLAPIDNDRVNVDQTVRLLLVEDDPLASRVMAQLLRRVGHQVTTATSVKGALSVPIDEYDLVVSDIGLPDGSGHDVMRQIRPRRNVPGIALTGYGSEDDARRARESGFVAHLVKPIDFAKLDTVIRQVAEAHTNGHG